MAAARVEEQEQDQPRAQLWLSLHRGLQTLIKVGLSSLGHPCPAVGWLCFHGLLPGGTKRLSLPFPHAGVSPTS